MGVMEGVSRLGWSTGGEMEAAAPTCRARSQRHGRASHMMCRDEDEDYGMVVIVTMQLMVSRRLDYILFDKVSAQQLLSSNPWLGVVTRRWLPAHPYPHNPPKGRKASAPPAFLFLFPPASAGSVVPASRPVTSRESASPGLLLRHEMLTLLPEAASRA